MNIREIIKYKIFRKKVKPSILELSAMVSKDNLKIEFDDDNKSILDWSSKCDTSLMKTLEHKNNI